MNIALIGLRGTGKSTCGRILAHRLGWQFLDTDELVQERAGKPIWEVFEEGGEASFRKLEAEVVAEVIGQSPSFINNYIRVYEKFGERLPEFSHIGVSKLEVVARLKEPVAYIEAHQEELKNASFKEVRKIVNAEKEKGVIRRSKRQAVHEDVGSFRLTLASNGRSLTVSNLNKEIQDDLLAVLKDYLSQRK